MKLVKTKGRNGAKKQTVSKETGRLHYTNLKNRVVTGEPGGLVAVVFSTGEAEILSSKTRHLVSELANAWSIRWEDALERAVRECAKGEEIRRRLSSERLQNILTDRHHYGPKIGEPFRQIAVKLTPIYERKKPC